MFSLWLSVLFCTISLNGKGSGNSQEKQNRGFSLHPLRHDECAFRKRPVVGLFSFQQNKHFIYLVAFLSNNRVLHRHPSMGCKVRLAILTQGRHTHNYCTNLQRFTAWWRITNALLSRNWITSGFSCWCSRLSGCQQVSWFHQKPFSLKVSMGVIILDLLWGINNFPDNFILKLSYHFDVILLGRAAELNTIHPDGL